MKYPSIEICKKLLFPLIREAMIISEPAPFYEYERTGLDKIESIFHLMESGYYPDELTQISYLFCSVIDGHPFSNGNKRLAVALLSYCLVMNSYKIHIPNMDALKEELQRLFPKLKWEQVKSFRYPHEYFFYHLALIIADRAQKGHITFRQEQEAVRESLTFIVLKQN
jgi:hypothetical protein